MGKIDMAAIVAEAKKIQSVQGQQNGEKVKVKYADIKDRATFTILQPWREEGLPWFTVGDHANLPGDKKFLSCPNSIPAAYRQETYVPCPVCEAYEQIGKQPEIWVYHYCSVVLEMEQEVSLLRIPTIVKNNVINYLSEGVDLVEKKVIKVIKKKQGLKTEYQFMVVDFTKDWKPNFKALTPYNLDDVKGKWVFSKKNHELLVGAASLILESEESESDKTIAEKIGTDFDFSYKKDEESKNQESESKTMESKPVPAKKLGKAGEVPVCYGSHGEPAKGLNCKSCKLEVTCKIETKKKK